MMTADDVKDELAKLRERVVRLETKPDEVSRRLESIQKYIRELYDHLQKRYR